MSVDRSTNWSALVVSLPTRNATPRMRLWRALKAAGCAVLRDGVYLMPQGDAADRLLPGLAQEVEASGGTAHLLALTARDEEQEREFRALFDRSEPFAELVGRIGAAHAALAGQEMAQARKAVKALRRDFAALAAIDFFPGDARSRAENALAELENAAQALMSPGEPSAATGEVTRRDRADYQGRTWATRERLWVDRMASAWLIRRFIDRQARFLWLDDPVDCPPDVLGFDFDGAAFTHVGNRVTFEVLLASFALEGDAGLAKLGALVHYLDAGGIPVAEAAGVETLLTGLRGRCAGDDALLDEAARIFDLLYTAYAD